MPGLTVLGERLAICRMDPAENVLVWATGATRGRGWCAWKLEGPFDLSMVGILASVASPLAEAGASIFAVSTYDTDYVLVREEQLDLAVDTLRTSEHMVDDHAVGGR